LHVFRAAAKRGFVKIQGMIGGLALIVAVLSLGITVRSDAERNASTDADHESVEKLDLYARPDSELISELDLAESGPSPGDRFVVSAPLFDAPVGGGKRARVLVDGYRVGEQVHEILTLAFGPGDQLIAAGSSRNGRPSLLGITGGSGRYLHAHGTIAVQQTAGGVKLVIDIRR
jgi:hypothetical protein